MSKVFKLFVVGLLTCAITAGIAGCSTKKQEETTPSGEESSGGKTTISDAYDWNEDETGSTRPGIEGGWYTPTTPITQVELTIAESSSVKFAGGKSVITHSLDKILTNDDFDASTLNGRTVEGLAVLGEDGGIRSFVRLEDFDTQEKELTVIPYFAPLKGESVMYGTSGIGDYAYNDGEDIQSQLVTKNVLVNNMAGIELSYDGKLSDGAYIRSLTAMTIKAGVVYGFYYTFSNNNDSAVTFTVYQMYGGTDYKTNAVASREITLGAGDVVTVPLFLAPTADNKNAIPLIVFGETESLKLGISMAWENATPSVPVNVNINIPEEYKDTFSVSDYNGKFTSNDAIVLPSESQMVNNTGYAFLWWEDENGNKVTEGGYYYGDITISPVFAEPVTVTFQGGSAVELVKGEDGKTTYEEYLKTLKFNDKLKLPAEGEYKNNSGVKIVGWEDGEGNRLAEGTVITGDMVIKPVLQEKVEISVRLPEGITVDKQGWTKKDGVSGNVYGVQLMEGNTLKEEGFNFDGINTAVKGYKFAGWYIEKQGTATGRKNFEFITSANMGEILVESGAVYAPYYVAEGYTLWFGNAQSEGNNNSSSGGVSDNVWKNGSSGTNDPTIDNQRMVVNEDGIVTLGVSYITSNGAPASFAEGGLTRINTSIVNAVGQKIQSGKTYTFTITIENRGTDIENMEFHYGNSGTTTNQVTVTTEDESITLCNTGDRASGFVVSLKAGETGTYVVSVALDSGLSNNNTLFVLKNAGATIENFAIGVSYSVVVA